LTIPTFVADIKGDGGRGAGEVGIADGVSEIVVAHEARVGSVSERAIGLERDRAVGWSIVETGGDQQVVRVEIISQYTGIRRDRERGVGGGGIGKVVSDGRELAEGAKGYAQQQPHGGKDFLEHILCECCDPNDKEMIKQFEQMYNIFAGLKGLAPLDRARMDGMAAAGALDISVAKDPDGNALVYHSNYRDTFRARSLELPSLYRKLEDSAARNVIGRANRLLTWSNIVRYQEQGLERFDFGGWYQGADPSMLKINEFKKGFGGQVVREYQCEQILTMKGWVVLYAARLLKRARLFSSPPSQPAALPKPEPVPG
jgi:hypothetical protein